MNSIVKKILGLSLTAALLGTGFAGCKDDTSCGTWIKPWEDIWRRKLQCRKELWT